ncbi:hypothetical protein ASwh1_129 [Aeromonas phage Aswh_1]|nr:hypothetical protein ASwh1_129 [Aeromonas phage Aswh_1]
MKWTEVANITNIVYKAANPQVKHLEDPLKDIYDNNLPGMLKDVVYKTTVHGIPVEVAFYMLTIYSACKMLDEHGYIPNE